VAPKLLLDEHLSPTIAHPLTALGFDVSCVRDRGLLGLDDWDLMEWCGKEGRAICTRDDEDFEREHKKYLARGEIHFGIVIVSEWRPRFWRSSESAESGLKAQRTSRC